MGGDKPESPFCGKPGQHMQQSHRIGPARYGNHDPFSRLSQPTVTQRGIHFILQFHYGHLSD
ncbi:hypothetical protein GCM10020370_61040 [Paenibacillus hodogayensis]